MATRNFSNRNLRNRSFRGQDLRQADFSDSDLRGCNFELAQLQGANFDRSRVGYGPESILIGLLCSVEFAGTAFHAISQMLFGVLGLTAEDPSYPYLLVLMFFLAIASSSSAASSVQGRAGRFYKSVAGLSTGALLGFFYGGILMGDVLRSAVVGAVITGGLGAMMSALERSRLVNIALCSFGGCAAYGTCFFTGSRATSLLSIQRVFVGGLWGLLSLLFLGLTLKNISMILANLQDFAHTSWRGADLTTSTFNGVKINIQSMSRYGLTGEVLLSPEHSEFKTSKPLR